MGVKEAPARAPARIDSRLEWYRDAIFYEVHVRSFADSNGDGVGDFDGLIAHLDHLKRLGVDVLWLLPFYASPGKDDGYDISDYNAVNPQYGTLGDFRRLIRAAHALNIKVITELVANHTSDQHAWFQRARRARPGSVNRDFYVWSDGADKYPMARVIFKDFEPSNWSWDNIANAYYWHRFYAHQPDLNFNSASVRREMFRVVDFWLGMGVDGFRLDAIPYLFEQEGTDCENLPQTHEFLRELRRHVDQHYPGRILLAEANQWPEVAVTYFGSGDECQMAFHFPLMPRLFMAIRMEDRFPIIDILAQTPQPPEGGQWAVFLRNHDELTLEMVTDEERDYMYGAYSEDPVARINLGIRRRLAPLLDNNRRRIELMNGLLFSLPGTPVIYYGDEIGMGDNIYLGDRNGVRTPMQWSPDRNAGFSQANPQKLYLPVVAGGEYHYETVNVESQLANPSSLLSWTRRLIRLRKTHLAFSRGSVEILQPSNRRVLAFVRQYEGQRILVVANLSRFAQQAQLDLSRWQGLVPFELFGESPFSAIGSDPYQMTLGPHEFFWFDLRSPDEPGQRPGLPSPAPLLRIPVGPWGQPLWGLQEAQLEAALPAYIQRQRWYGGKTKRLRTLRIADLIGLQTDARHFYLALAEIAYFDGSIDTYMVPLALVRGAPARHIEEDQPWAVVAAVRAPAGRE
ncbi:MAG: maltose alpha-D-glucosyltransferase, partial [Candidatus Dormibacteraceae bacterium]